MAMHGVFPAYRPRALRQTPALRRLTRETSFAASQLILPLFVRSGRNVREAVGSMPGVFQLSPDQAMIEARKAQEAGVAGVILFGIPEHKDEKASGAYARNGAVQQTTRALKKEYAGEFLVVTDVCLCEYMSHGHCGIVDKRDGGKVLNDATLPLLARAAVSHAEAGADIVAPSDMMDGRVARFARRWTRSADLPDIADSGLCGEICVGVLRAVPGSGGIRAAIRRPAVIPDGRRERARGVAGGGAGHPGVRADMVMVKPALAYLDILHQVKTEFGYPTAAYAVSGEFAMIKAAAAKGWIDERAVTLETLRWPCAGQAQM